MLVFNFIDAKSTLSMGNEVKEYDTIFEKIAVKRVGVEAAAIDRIVNPFIVTYDNGVNFDDNVSQKPLYVLEATLNQRAKINGSWYTIHDQIDIFKLVKIKANSVTLQNETDRKEIFIRTNDESNIKIFSK